MKLNKKIILTLGTTTIIGLPISTAISCGTNHQHMDSNLDVVVPNTSNPSLLPSDEVNLKSPDQINVQSPNQTDLQSSNQINVLSYDQQDVNQVTADQINKVVLTVVNKKLTPYVEAMDINDNDNLHTLKVGKGVTAIIHAHGHDATDSITYDVTSLTKGSATRSSVDLAKLGGTITGFAPTVSPKQKDVDAITAAQIHDVVLASVNRALKASVVASSINSIPAQHTFMVGNGVTAIIHATSNDTTKILSYTVTSLRNGMATRATKDLPSLGGTVTGFSATPDQQAVDSITHKQIVGNILTFTYKQEFAGQAAFALNEHAPWNINGTAVTIHATGDDNTQSLSYTITSTTKGSASRAAAELPSLGGTFEGFNKTPGMIFVEAVTAKQINLAVDKVCDHSYKATVIAANINKKQNIFTIAPNGVQVKIHATGDDNAQTLSYTVISVTYHTDVLPAASLAKLDGTLNEFAPTDQKAVDTLTMINVSKAIYPTIVKLAHGGISKKRSTEEVASDFNSNESQYFTTLPYHVQVRVHLKALGDSDIRFTTTFAIKGNAERANLDDLIGDINFPV